MFIDEVVVTVASGKGGRGAVSFRREKYVPKGGPDGGNGGRGGDVIVRAISHKNTLVDFRHVTMLKAKNGGPGGSSNCTGKSAPPLYVDVPAGTLVYEEETGFLLADLDALGKEYRAAQGGRGGRGNSTFTSSTHRTPRRAGPGGPAEEVTLRLELKMLADVGLVGFPSVGKSTLISAISGARPEIADYPFTTLIPNLGVVERFKYMPFVVADVPGLIPGAHEGKGLGIQFLKHIQRTKVIVHLLDCTRPDPLEDYHAIRLELSRFDEALIQRVELVAINKLDLFPDGQDASEVSALITSLTDIGLKVFPISAVSGHGLDNLLKACARLLRKAKP